MEEKVEMMCEKMSGDASDSMKRFQSRRFSEHKAGWMECCGLEVYIKMKCFEVYSVVVISNY